MKNEQLRLYAITDGEDMQQVEQALQGGITMLQLRIKQKPYEQVKERALAVKKICHAYQVPLIINDYVELAREIQTDGVHIGQDDCSVYEARKRLGKDYIIGATAKTPEQAKTAQEQGADYLGSGAVFGSMTKLDAKPMTKELLEKICHSVSIPVVAIGGITVENIEQLGNRGIAGVAVIGGIFGQADVKQTTQLFLEKLNRMNL